MHYSQYAECTYREGTHPSGWEEAIDQGGPGQISQVTTISGLRRKIPADTLKVITNTHVHSLESFFPPQINT